MRSTLQLFYLTLAVTPVVYSTPDKFDIGGGHGGRNDIWSSFLGHFNNDERPSWFGGDQGQQRGGDFIPNRQQPAQGNPLGALLGHGQGTVTPPPAPPPPPPPPSTPAAGVPGKIQKPAEPTTLVPVFTSVLAVAPSIPTVLARPATPAPLPPAAPAPHPVALTTTFALTTTSTTDDTTSTTSTMSVDSSMYTSTTMEDMTSMMSSLSSTMTTGDTSSTATSSPTLASMVNSDQAISSEPPVNSTLPIVFGSLGMLLLFGTIGYGMYRRNRGNASLDLEAPVPADKDLPLDEEFNAQIPSLIHWSVYQTSECDTQIDLRFSEITPMSPMAFTDDICAVLQIDHDQNSNAAAEVAIDTYANAEPQKPEPVLKSRVDQIRHGHMRHDSSATTVQSHESTYSLGMLL